MLLSLIPIILAAAPLHEQQQAQERPRYWYIEEDEVTAYGPLTIVVLPDLPRTNGVWVEIPGRKEVRLGALGPMISLRGNYREAAVLAWIDMEIDNLEAVEPPDVYRPRPVCAEPGELCLTLLHDGQSYGTDCVTVLPADEQEGAVRELLFPRVNPKATSDPYGFRWVLALGRGLDTSSPEELLELEPDLPVISKHPGWAEVVEAQFALWKVQNVHRKLTQDLAPFMPRFPGEDPPVFKDYTLVDEQRLLDDARAYLEKPAPKGVYTRRVREHVAGEIEEVEKLMAQRDKVSKSADDPN